MSDIEKERAARLARMLRERLGVDHLVQMDMVRVLDEMKRQRLILDYKEVPKSEIEGAEGRFDPQTGTMCFPLGTLHGAARGDARSNFTIAHEIGHWADGVREVRNRGAVRGRRTAKDERLADAFAAEFLAPYHKADFSSTTTPDDVRKRFNLSASAADIRHDELSREFRKRNKIERSAPATVVDFQQELRKRGGFPATPTARTAAKSASSHRQAVAAVLSQPAYDDRACPKCGKTALLSIGVKYLCDTVGCGYVGDLPDGD